MSASSSGSARGNQEEPHHAPSSGGWSLPTGRPMAAMLHCRRSVLDADAAPSPEVVALRSRFPSSRAGISFCLSVSVCSELPAMTTFRVRCTGSPLLEWRLFWPYTCTKSTVRWRLFWAYSSSLLYHVSIAALSTLDSHQAVSIRAQVISF